MSMYLPQPCFANITEFIGKRCYKYIAVHHDTGVSRDCENTVSKVIHFVTIAICTNLFQFVASMASVWQLLCNHVIVREEDNCYLIL